MLSLTCITWKTIKLRQVRAYQSFWL